MKVLFLSKPSADVEKLVLTLRLRWTDLSPFVVTEGKHVAKLIFDEAPELVIVCQQLPDLSINGAIKDIRSVTDAPILVVTNEKGNEDGSIDVVSALELGADDYIQLPRDMMEVMARAVCVSFVGCTGDLAKTHTLVSGRG